MFICARRRHTNTYCYPPGFTPWREMRYCYNPLWSRSHSSGGTGISLACISSPQIAS